MKKWAVFLLLFPSLAVAEQTKTIFNPFTGKLDYITKVDSTTLPSGSTYYIQNTLTPTTTTQVFSVAQGVFTSTDNATSAVQVWAKQGQTANLLTVSTAPASVAANDLNTVNVDNAGNMNMPYLSTFYWAKSSAGQPKLVNSGNGQLQIWANPVIGVPNFSMGLGVTIKGVTNTGDENPANASLQFNTFGLFGTNYGRPFLFSFGHDSTFTFGVRNNGTYTWLSTNTASGSISAPLFEMFPSFIDDAHTQGRMIFNTCHGGFSATVDEAALTMQSDGARAIIAVGSGPVVANQITTVYASSNTYKPLVIVSTVSQSVNVTEWQDNTGSSGTVVTADLALVPFPKTKAQLQAFAPKVAGEMFYCTDCTVDDVVVSTGTVAGSFARMGARTTAIQ